MNFESSFSAVHWALYMPSTILIILMHHLMNKTMSKIGLSIIIGSHAGKLSDIFYLLCSQWFSPVLWPRIIFLSYKIGSYKRIRLIFTNWTSISKALSAPLRLNIHYFAIEGTFHTWKLECSLVSDLVSISVRLVSFPCISCCSSSFSLIADVFPRVTVLPFLCRFFY